MNRGRVALAILAGLAAAGVAWLTFVAWVVAGITYDMEPVVPTTPLGEWANVAVGAPVVVALAWASRHFWRSARDGLTPARGK
jgi:hypothetical protein